MHIFYFIRDIIKKNSNGQIDLKKIGNKAVALFNKQPKALRNAELVGFIVVVIAAGSIGQLIKTGGNDITKTGNEITSSYVDQNKQDSNKAIEDDKEQEQEEVEVEAQDPGEKIDGTRTIDKHRNYSENGKIKDIFIRISIIIWP